MFAASVATEALLFPVGASVFSRVTFAGLALNFLAIPLMAVAQIAGMAVVPLSLVSRAAAHASDGLRYAGAAGLVASADLVRFAPMVTYRIAQPTVGRAHRLLPGPGRGLARATRDPFRRLMSAAAVVAVALALWILIDPRTLAARGDGQLHVTFLDVGQGDSAFVVFPHGSTLLVDAGGLGPSSSFDIGDRVVAPVMSGRGHRRIDHVALTHGDPDHIGGAPSILREFRPREVWEGIPVPRSSRSTRCDWRPSTGATLGQRLSRRSRLVIDEVEVARAASVAADWERQKVRNDDSLVLELRWRDVSVLLTGDIGKPVERDVAAAIPPARCAWSRFHITAA